MITEQLVKRIAKIVFKRGGISCSANNLVKAIKAGIKATHSPTAIAFLKLLEKNDSESNKTLETLIKYLTQKGLSFFQPDYLFELLRQDILPSLIDKYTTLKQSLKIWNINCKTGEIIYSLAIILNEFLPLDSASIELLATDNNEFNLQQAQKGIYQEWALRKVSFDILSKYFTPREKGYQINETINNFINFSKLDIINDTYPSNIDLIFCSEWVASSSPDFSLDEVYEHLYASLNINGYLLIDSLDIPEHITNRMKPLIYPEGVIYQKIKKPDLKKTYEDIEESCLEIEEQTEQETRLDPVVITKIPPKEIIIEEEIEEENDIKCSIKNNPAELERLLKKDPYNKFLMWKLIKELWEEGELLKSKDWCERFLSLEPLNAQAQYLMGCLFEELGEPGQAMKAYEKLITINPESVIAYFSIGCIANQLQQPKKALKYFKHTHSMLTGLDESLNIELAEHIKVNDLASMVDSKISSLTT